MRRSAWIGVALLLILLGQPVLVGAQASRPDGSLYQQGVTSLTPGGAVYQASPPTITDGTLTIPRLDVNGNLKVNIASGGGTGGGPADAAANAAASETDTGRQKVTSAIRLLDTAQTAGSQLVTAKGDQTSGLWVNCKAGCSSSNTNYGSAFPAAGQAIGFKDITGGTNMQYAGVVDADTGAGTVFVLVNNLVRRASGGPVRRWTTWERRSPSPRVSARCPTSSSAWRELPRRSTCGRHPAIGRKPPSTGPGPARSRNGWECRG